MTCTVAHAVHWYEHGNLPSCSPVVPSMSCVFPQAHRFLEQQAEQWAAVSLQLHAWLGRLVAMYDTHRSKTGTDEAGKDRSQSAARLAPPPPGGPRD